MVESTYAFAHPSYPHPNLPPDRGKEHIGGERRTELNNELNGS
jgi:hypothetical protein